MKKFTVKPKKPNQASITMPGDKSISHRAVMLASIADGDTLIKNFLPSLDCLATINAMRDMGVSIEGPLQENEVIVHGVGKNGLKDPPSILHLGNSGTAMRLLSGLLAGHGITAILEGDFSLKARPMKRIIEPLMYMGAKVTCADTGGAPIMIHHPKERLVGLQFQSLLPSAQVKSAILLAGLYAQGQTTVHEKIFTRDHTERMLETFSYPVQRLGTSTTLTGGGRLIGTEIQIPGDLSSAAFFIVAFAMTPGSELDIDNVGINPGRIGILNILWEMGAQITIEDIKEINNEPIANLHISGQNLRGIEIPLSQIALAIDEFPAIFIAAACATGKTILRGADELRLKESDRILAMAQGLSNLGINVEMLDDGIIIHGGDLHGGIVDSHADHRVAMAFTMAACATKQPITILNTESIATSFPDFIKVARECGLVIHEESMEEP